MRLDPVRTKLSPPGVSRPESASRFGGMIAGDSAAPAAETGQAARVETGLLLAAAIGGAEAGDDRATRARQARRHADCLLNALAGLQIGLLSGEAACARLVLADLATRLPDSDDSALRGALRAIAQRAAIELARRG